MVSIKNIMANEAVLEERIAVLERAVADLQRQLAAALPPSNWLERVTGSVADEEAFLKALEFGRALRQADRPPEETGEPS